MKKNKFRVIISGNRKGYAVGIYGEFMSLDDRKYNYLLEQNKKYMDYVALSFMNGKKITYEELHEGIQKYAKILYKKGIREGDVVGVCVLNTPESVYLLYALDIIGAVTVGFSPLDNKEKIKRDIQLTSPSKIITVDMFYGNFKDSEKALDISTLLYSPFSSCDDVKLKLGYKAMQIKNGNFKLSLSDNLKPLFTSKVVVKAAPFVSGQVTDILFTGGSTGVHKGVDLAGEGLNYVVDGMDSIFDAEPGMVHLGNIPISHMAYGRMIMHYALCHNMELALTLKAMPEDFYDELVRTHANAGVGGPPHWVSLIEKVGDKFVPNSKLKPGTLSELHYATSGGEAKKKTTDKAINEALAYCGSDAILGDGLGATESWASIMINNGRNNTPGTIGRNISHIDVKLIDPHTAQEVEPGEKGLLYISGPSVMVGYHNNPEETAKVISYDEQGKKWCNTGDFVKLTDTGEYSYCGRQKRNFVSGVENIYPEELEGKLPVLPEIRELVVTAIPDEMRQFIPSYHISIYDENLDTELFKEKLYDYVEKTFGENWTPGYIECFPEPLVRMQNEKVDIGYYAKRDEKILKDNRGKVYSKKKSSNN